MAQKKKIEVKLGNKPVVLDRVDFKRIQNLPPPGPDYLDPKPSLLLSTYKYAYDPSVEGTSDSPVPRIWSVKHDERLSTGIDPKSTHTHAPRKKSIFAGFSPSTRMLGVVIAPKGEKGTETEPFLVKDPKGEEEALGESGEKTKYVPPSVPTSTTSSDPSLVGLESEKSRKSQKSSSESKEED